MDMKKLATILAGATLLGGALVSGTTISPAAAQATAECTSHDVSVRYRHTDDGAGHRYGRIVMRNVSAHACRSGGFGGLSYVGFGDGTQVGAAADRAGRTTHFTLQPGQRAVSRVDETNARNYTRRRCSPHAVDGFRVYIPDETASLYVPHPTTGCLDSDVHLLAHRAFRKR
jgi:hypothetical protein